MNDAPTLTAKFQQAELYTKLAKILRENWPYHYCHVCARITELESDDAHGQVCVHCGSHRVSYHEKRSVDYTEETTLVNNQRETP